MDEIEVIVAVTELQDIGERADVVLGRRVQGLSRRMARRMALQGRLTVGNRPVPPSFRVSQGARLVLRWQQPPAARDLHTLQVTERFLFVDKPAGLHTHRLRPDEPPALADAVVAVHPECADASPDPREGGALHRLDRDTSGVVAFARSREAWIEGRVALSEGRVKKTYLALCRGGVRWPPPAPADNLPGWIVGGDAAGELLVCAPVGRGAPRSRMAVTVRGQPARTRVRPVAAAEGHTLCALELLTGRRHQARLHLSWLGLPIVGDPLYGEAGSTPLLLHAFRLDLGPLGQQVQAECPSAFRAELERLGISPAHL